MKKILTGLLVCFLTVFMTVSSASALDVNEVNDAYEKVIEYYQKKDKLDDDYWLDEIIAIETLGLETENLYDIPNIEEKITSERKISSGKLGKYIIASILVGQDPNKINLNGKSLVENLESFIEDGKVKDDDQSSNVVWVLFALEAISSENVNSVAKELSNSKNEDKGFWNYDYYNPGNKISGPDTTGWAIEALTIANENESVKETIEEYLMSIQDENDAHWNDSWSSPANVDTQSCVLEGLLVYNKEDVKNDKYDKNGVSPFQAIFDAQLENGSFEAYYEPGVSNAYATLEGARCLGTYMNESFVLKAQKAYKELINNIDKDEPVKKPNQEEKPSVDVKKEDTNKENVANQNNQQTTTEKDKLVTKTENAKIVETSDSNNINGLIAMAVVSGGLFIILRRKNEDICK